LGNAIAYVSSLQPLVAKNETDKTTSISWRNTDHVTSSLYK